MKKSDSVCFQTTLPVGTSILSKNILQENFPVYKAFLSFTAAKTLQICAMLRNDYGLC